MYGVINGSAINGDEAAPAAATTSTATGFCATQLGTPASSLSHLAAGSTTTQLGTPRLTRFTASVGAAPATRLGTPGAIAYGPAAGQGWLAQAYGSCGTAFGAPTARWRQTGAPASLHTTQLGTPLAASTYHALGSKGTLFGTPAARLVGHVVGLYGTQLGKPLARRVQPASGLWTTRIGAPKAGNYITGQVSGLGGAQLGSPSSVQTHRVASIAPVAFFGNPLLKRALTC